MQCKQELDYIVLVLNDYLGSLPMSSRVAVGERVQVCVSNIEQALGGPTPEASPEADPAK